MKRDKDRKCHAERDKRVKAAGEITVMNSMVNAEHEGKRKKEKERHKTRK